jgi:hypothetical protein
MKAGAGIELAQARHDIVSRAAGEIDLGDDDVVGHCRLLDRLGLLLERDNLPKDAEKHFLEAKENGAGIIIDKPILELLRITPETELDLSTDGERLIITPIRPPARW